MPKLLTPSEPLIALDRRERLIRDDMMLLPQQGLTGSTSHASFGSAGMSDMKPASDGCCDDSAQALHKGEYSAAFAA